MTRTYQFEKSISKLRGLLFKSLVIPFLFTFLLLSVTSICCLAAVSASKKDSDLKSLPKSVEKFVSTYIPSDAAPNGGLAVTISYPTMSRYKEDGSPVVVLVPGYQKASGLRFTMNAPQVGFVEIRFAFPGGGLKKFHSGGSFDNRGLNSQKALRDVLLFAKGLSKDYKGRTLDKLTPRRIDYKNVGLVGWHDGFNIILTTMTNYHENLNFINWIASYESPVGSLLLPSNLGTTKELNLNKYYRQGSAATGKCVIDFAKLSYDPNRFRERTKRTKRNLHTPKGILFFDDNKNGKFDELTEFPLNYSIEPGVKKQFYCPEITNALKLSGIFKTRVDLLIMTDESFEKLKKSNPEIITMLGSTKKPKVKDEVSKPQPKRLFKNRTVQVEPAKRKKREYKYDLEIWPKSIATLKESESFYALRDGAIYVEKVARLYPNLLVTVFGSRIDHNEQQPDHPHIALHYNLWLASKPKWVRLNPAKVYVGFTADMNPDNFVNNKANSPIDSSNIKAHLEPEGFITDSMYMRATISELADRVRNKDYSSPLEGVLESYLNEAMLVRQMKLNEKQNDSEPESDLKVAKRKSFDYLPNVEYTTTRSFGERQQLDLYIPETKSNTKFPLVVFLHGGGWNKGSEDSVPYRKFIDAGIAVASVNYRYSTQSKFPAQIQDCQTAIRFLRKHASEYKINPKQIGVWGVSSGGHLAMLLATSSGTDRFSSNSKTRSDIQAACEWFSPVDLPMLFERKRCSKELLNLTKKLLGGKSDTLMAKAKFASPMTYIRKDLPPILIMHGDNDVIVPMEQSQDFYNALKAKGAPATLIIKRGVGHGVDALGPKSIDEVVKFFKQELK